MLWFIGFALIVLVYLCLYVLLRWVSGNGNKEDDGGDDEGTVYSVFEKEEYEVDEEADSSDGTDDWRYEDLWYDDDWYNGDWMWHEELGEVYEPMWCADDALMDDWWLDTLVPDEPSGMDMVDEEEAIEYQDMEEEMRKGEHGTWDHWLSVHYRIRKGHGKRGKSRNNWTREVMVA